MKIPIPEGLNDKTRHSLERVDAMLAEIEAYYKHPVREAWVELTQVNPALAARMAASWYQRMKFDKKYFGAKYQREEQRIFIMWQSKVYQDDLLAVRKKVSIPNSYKPSGTTIHHSDGSVQNVYYKLKTPKLDRLLDQEADRLIKKHHLTKRHHGWVRDTILNDREPHGFTYYETNYLDKLSLEINWPKIPDFNLTTGEKRYLKDEVRVRLGVKGGRPAKGVQGKYDVFLRYLSQSKNILRRLQDHIDTARVVTGTPYKKLANEKMKSKRLTEEIDRLEKKKWRLNKRYPHLKKVKN